MSSSYRSGSIDYSTAYIVDAMKLNPFDTVADIAQNVGTALRFGVRYKVVLSRTAQERYDWTSVARKLSHELDALSPTLSESSKSPAAGDARLPN